MINAMKNETDKEKQNAHKNGIVQFIKFLLVSAIASVIQLGLANLLPAVFDGVRAEIPGFLRFCFDPDTLFDYETASGAAEAAKYVVNGTVTWGFVLPFFISNAAANIYGYIQNKKTTFKSDAPPLNFVIYFALLTALILFSTWLQGLIFGQLRSTGVELLSRFARTIASIAAGTLQMAVLFPVEKFVLLKPAKNGVESPMTKQVK